MSKSLLVALAIAGIALVWFFQESRSLGARADALADNNAELAGLVRLNAQVVETVNDITGALLAGQRDSDARAQKREADYRAKITSEACAAVYLPDDVARGLLDHAATLRARAVSAAAAGADGPAAGGPASRRLTYRQAVLWINRLLAGQEDFINRLEAIRAADNTRTGISK